MPNRTNLPGSFTLTRVGLGLIFAAAVVLSGCGGSGGGVMSAIGQKKNPATQLPKNIVVQIDTAKNLNANAQGKGLSAVLRIYKLKDATAFKQASSEKLFDAESAKAILGQDLLESKEELLIPGQHYQFKEKVDAQNGYLAIAIFFRKPHPQRWKIIVPNSDLKEGSPLILGAHACAINIASGITDPKELAEKFYVANAKCDK